MLLAETEINTTGRQDDLQSYTAMQSEKGGRCANAHI